MSIGSLAQACGPNSTLSGCSDVGVGHSSRSVCLGFCALYGYRSVVDFPGHLGSNYADVSAALTGRQQDYHSCTSHWGKLGQPESAVATPPLDYGTY